MTEEVKICNSCNSELPLSNFYKNRNSRLGQCKECCYVKEKTYRATSKGATSKRNATLLRKYNIDYAIYEQMFIEQNENCLICECKIKLFGDKSVVAHVDHCHTTGVIRGLLCSACNTSLGKFKDSVELLQNAIQYLKDNNGTKPNAIIVKKTS